MEIHTSVEVKKRGAIAEIIFGSSKGNSLTGETLDLLEREILECSSNREIKCILIKSKGEKIFCAGASFDEMLAINNLEMAQKFFSGFYKVLLAIKNCSKIVVVRAQGKSTGGGVGLLCAADYVFATKDSSIALTELNLGIGPFVIEPFVSRKIGKSEFLAMALDTEFRKAKWAKKNHIYHEIFKNIEEMDEKIESFLQKLTAHSQKALAQIKNVSWVSENLGGFDENVLARIEMSAQLVLEDETKEKIIQARAFLKK